MDYLRQRARFALIFAPAIIAAAHCSSFPQKGDIPVTMSQVREGTPVYNSAPQPVKPVVSQRALPAQDVGEMEVAVPGGLNYRAKPGLGGKILGAIPYRTKVTVVDRSPAEDIRGVTGKWYKISYRGETGYVNSKYLRSAGDARIIYAEQSRSRKKRAKKKPEAITNVPR